MNLIEFMLSALICTAAAYFFLKLTVVWPARKRANLQQAYTDLSASLKKLNKDIMLSGAIKNGDHLHDKFYRSIYCFYLFEYPSKIKVRTFEITPEMEEERKKFRNELNRLDPELKAVVESCNFSIGQILFYSRPITFMTTVYKYARQQSLKEKMIKSGEYAMINESRNGNNRFDRHCPAC